MTFRFTALFVKVRAIWKAHYRKFVEFRRKLANEFLAIDRTRCTNNKPTHKPNRKSLETENGFDEFFTVHDYYFFSLWLERESLVDFSARGWGRDQIYTACTENKRDFTFFAILIFQAPHMTARDDTDHFFVSAQKETTRDAGFHRGIFEHARTREHTPGNAGQPWAAKPHDSVKGLLFKIRFSK